MSFKGVGVASEDADEVGVGQVQFADRVNVGGHPDPAKLQQLIGRNVGHVTVNLSAHTNQF